MIPNCIKVKNLLYFNSKYYNIFYNLSSFTFNLPIGHTIKLTL